MEMEIKQILEMEKHFKIGRMSFGRKLAEVMTIKGIRGLQQ